MGQSLVSDDVCNAVILYLLIRQSKLTIQEQSSLAYKAWVFDGPRSTPARQSDLTRTLYFGVIPGYSSRHAAPRAEFGGLRMMAGASCLFFWRQGACPPDVLRCALV